MAVRMEEHLQRCYELARERLPKAIFDEVPNDLWSVYPMGRHIIMRRFPKTSKVGSIIIAEAHQAPVNAGWALIPSPEVATPGPGLTQKWDWDPYDMVGMALVTQPMRGTTLRLSMVQRQYQGDYISVHIQDILAVMTKMDENDWKPEKEFRL